MTQILEYLKTHGEQLDAEIAKAAGFSLEKTRGYLAELAAQGEIMTYHSTRYMEGERIEGIRCRISGFTPSAKPGRKSKAS
jgi:DNA-binding IclR family transcriptional regulator